MCRWRSRRAANIGLTHAGEKRTDNPEAGAHPGNELIRRGRVHDIAGGEMDRAGIGAVLVFATSVHGIIDAMIAQDADQLLDIGQMGHVFQRERIVGEKRGDHQGKGSVFSAGNGNDAVELVAADDFNAIHAVHLLGRSICPAIDLRQVRQPFRRGGDAS